MRLTKEIWNGIWIEKGDLSTAEKIVDSRLNEKGGEEEVELLLAERINARRGLLHHLHLWLHLNNDRLHLRALWRHLNDRLVLHVHLRVHRNHCHALHRLHAGWLLDVEDRLLLLFE